MKDFKIIGYKRHIDRWYFYALSLFAVGLFILAWFYPESHAPKMLQMPLGVMNKGDFLWSGFLLISLITIVIGLLFVPKNILVWFVRGLLLAPHVFLLLIFTDLGEGTLFQSIVSAVRAYLLGNVQWFPLNWTQVQ